MDKVDQKASKKKIEFILTGLKKNSEFFSIAEKGLEPLGHI